MRRARAGAGVSSTMLPRRPTRTRRTSQMPLEGPPVVPPREEVGGGVIRGLLVAAKTALARHSANPAALAEATQPVAQKPKLAVVGG